MTTGVHALSAVLAAASLLAAGCATAPASIAGPAGPDSATTVPAADGDVLKVTMCGTSGPLPVRDRAKPCVAIQAGGDLFLVDIGPEATEQLQFQNVPNQTAKAVFLTHFHSDHIGGLGEFNMQSWVAGRAQPLLVIGPPGVEKVAEGFNLAYELDHVYRHAHHDTETVKLPVAAGRLTPRAVSVSERDGAKTGVAYEQGALRVTAIEVNHEPVAPAYGYRFDYRGRSVVISGDTSAHPPLAVASKGADVLIHEAQNAAMMTMASNGAKALGNARGGAMLSDTLSYHATPVEAAEIAKAAGVDVLVLTHITQAAMPMYSDAAFVRGIETVGVKDWRLATDGMTIDLPVGTDEIVIKTP